MKVLFVIANKSSFVICINICTGSPFIVRISLSLGFSLSPELDIKQNNQMSWHHYQINSLRIIPPPSSIKSKNAFFSLTLFIAAAESNGNEA